MWTLRQALRAAACCAVTLAIPAAVGHAVQVLPPAGALANPGAALAGVSCANVTSCAAAGDYVAASNSLGNAAMVATGSTGRWARATAVRLPSDAEANASSVVDAVSCPAAGSCVVAGSYDSKPAGASSVMIAAQSRARWGRAIRLTLPANAAANASSLLFGLSCPRPGACVAAGGYATARHGTQAMTVSQSGGRWQRGTEITPPRNAAGNPFSILRSVWCTGRGTCAAVGTYFDPRSTEHGDVVTESNGRWGRAIELPVPAGASSIPKVIIGSISCLRPGSCVASGSYFNRAGNQEAMIITESGARWHAIEIAPPGGAGANPVAVLRSVTCTRPGSCLAVGTYETASSQDTAMQATESGGRWRLATNVSLPRGAASGAQAQSRLFVVACVSNRACVAAGNYQTSGSDLEAMAVALPPP